MADRSKHSGSSGFPFQARNDSPARQLLALHTPAATLRLTNVELPPVYLTMHDRERLRTLTASKRVQDDDNLCCLLRREIDRATICTPHTVPSDVVTLNSRVLYRSVGGQLKCGTLVYDDNVAVVGAAVAVFTPIGVALLGLRVGFRMPYLSQQGERSLLVVERVAYQPEAYGRLNRGRFRRCRHLRRPIDASEAMKTGKTGTATTP